MNQGFKLTPYKGYIGTINAEVELGYYWGVISDINIPIEYEADTLQELQFEFQSAVDDFLRMAGIDEIMEHKDEINESNE